MKNRRVKDDFSRLKTRLYWRTVGLMLGVGAVVYALYAFVLHGRFADWAVEYLSKNLHILWHEALLLYNKVVRQNTELILIVGIAVMFLIVLRVAVNWFARYMNEISRGIESVPVEDTGDVSLSPELSAVENKINTLKHTMENRKLDMQLAERRKNEFIMYLAHDLKTPLASVIGYLNLLRDTKDLPESAREKYLNITLNKAERLEDLISEFFEISKFSLSTMELSYSRVSLNRLLEQVAYEFLPMLKEKGLRCSFRIPENIMLRCDPDQLQRVFDNLLRNAVFYSYPDTVIQVAARQEEDSVMIRFSNRGPTIPPERLERIFEQFYRLDPARGTNNGGAGLGLAIAREVVELHHGTITADSRDECVEFTVCLPAS